MLRAGDELLRLMRSVTAKLRFNKATLFSWLVFCYWAPVATGMDLPPQLLENFEGHRRALKRSEGFDDLPPELVGALSLYDDRASYRVTDVSSVLARDCVFYLYLERLYNAPPIHHSHALLDELSDVSETHAQNIILDFVSTDEWGILATHRVVP